MADVVRQAQFRTLSWGYDVDFDPQGAPRQDCYLIFNSRRIGAGTYKLSFQGRADVSLSASSGGVLTNMVYDAASNTSSADVVLAQDSVGNTWLTFRNTRRTATSSSADGIGNVHLWRPGYPTDGSVLFTQEFIAAMQKFSVIRAMDFVNANSNSTQTWAERTPINWLGSTGNKGQSWELMVMLANAANRDLWINVPVKADDAYIQKLANLLKYGSDGSEPYISSQSKPKYPSLKPGLRVYVEYGNEVWNSGPGFWGFRWALELANANRLDTSHPIAYDGPVNDQYIALRRWIAYRSAFISQTFRNVFGDAAMMSTVRPILAGQVGNGNLYLSLGLAWAEGYYGDVTKLWYGGGGAAYYDSSVQPTDTSAATMQAYFDNLPTASFGQSVAKDAVWTKGYGLKTVAYEGGPGPGGSALGSISGTEQLAYTYNADPRMKDRMLVASDIWLANGGDLLVYYVYSGSPPWSFVDGLSLSTVSDTTSPKLQAIDALVKRPLPSVTLGTAVPGSVYLRSSTSAIQTRTGGDTSWGFGGTAYRINANESDLAKSEMVLLPIRVAQSGQYKISMTTLNATATDRLQLFVDGKLMGELQPVADSSGQPKETSSLAVALPGGLSVVRVRASKGSVWIRDLVVK
ncbi:hypothetical protein [Extensimonas perlucida]|uniref:hypothetical protein n=1 Tax=Extensimonas perlucida TaxID=2590786 RepID=UPI0011A9ADBE|nr:hypothetical protein [Extensimonas perlucida]